MSTQLMREFEEFEGPDKLFETTSVVDAKEEDDSNFQPANAANLTTADIFYELEKRGLKSTGFQDTDREMLQKAFDQEFKNDLEEMRAKRREKLRKAAQQAGLQRRRLLMEKTLQEEQDELARNHQIGMMIELIKENLVAPQLRIEVNSISARSLSKAMWANNTITCLDLSSNDLNDHAGSYIAAILKRNYSVKKIELDNNALGPKTCQAFGDSLTKNNSLVYLSLDSNPLSSESDHSGIKYISDAIKVNKSLTSLNLWRTGISAIAGGILASAIEQNTTLLFCDIGQNNIQMSDVKRIVDQLDANLRAFEAYERKKRQNLLTEAEKEEKANKIKEAEISKQELAKWLQERREQRSEEKRLAEELRIARLQEELEEKKRLEQLRKEEERKAAEEAAAKKAKKKGGKKGKK
mmetsp:Transcript_15476/g.21170  ORF Transcript_15476/g.21170 Transcript_15476/m.21170 type:complete len:410 (+) Transcript_15476:57-1286(+)|eukprot:CAMPEP_0170113444 /NCGR_PEP_ID=MMETSP0020_2-20130122/9900_1 /TAXON_ID=98059 /ORGANISM="Dinobryon sp., Strain UTEXLB2267" /LENGTH=409 /DNA_ID=CAMNT_0010339817 /DNA_START=42 /DNA_END=1271 /DNA_ORIENTATION=+